MFELYIKTQEFLHIPYFDNRYRINVNGIVIYDKGELTGKELLKGVNEHGCEFVELVRGDVYSTYELSFLIAVTFKPLKLPEQHIFKLKVLYRNSDVTNYHPSNLIWKYPIGGLECETYPGFFYIPLFSNYVINKVGVIFNLRALLFQKYAKNAKGYQTCCLILDFGKPAGFSRHRALALTFLDYDHRIDSLDVNHINGIPGSDDLRNLELVTRARNIEHAKEFGLMIDKSLGVNVRNVITNEVTFFKSHTECAKYFDVNSSTIDNRVQNLNQWVYNHQWQFKSEKDMTPWREVSKAELTTPIPGQKKTILIRNAKTNVVCEYASLTECSDALHVEGSLIRWKLKQPYGRIFENYTQYKYGHDPRPWLEVPDLEHQNALALKNANVLAQPVVCRNLRTNEFIEFSAKEKACRFMNKDLRKALRKNKQLIYPGYYQFKFKKPETPWRTPVNLEEEHRQAIQREIKNGIRMSWK